MHLRQHDHQTIEPTEDAALEWVDYRRSMSRAPSASPTAAPPGMSAQMFRERDEFTCRSTEVCTAIARGAPRSLLTDPGFRHRVERAFRRRLGSPSASSAGIAGTVWFSGGGGERYTRRTGRRDRTSVTRAACASGGSCAAAHERMAVTIRDLPCFGRAASLSEVEAALASCRMYTARPRPVPRPRRTPRPRCC